MKCFNFNHLILLDQGRPGDVDGGLVGHDPGAEPRVDIQVHQGIPVSKCSVFLLYSSINSSKRLLHDVRSPPFFSGLIS